ncbi:MAG: UDP-4-amino-4,6-dideoxy-N-acetyl-beta-L-altrosamine transaminase [Candidatus Omnitrophota bacterium]|jgi:UDP-4-amino-4,6-dideoxy-N-acetyl-beta-L-altrosamine transaminase
MISYGHQYIDRDDIDAVIKVLKSDYLTQGPSIPEFEDMLCRYTGARYAVAVSSGTAALHISCLAAGLRSGDEAITSPVTFTASANCVLYCGAIPIFADIQSDTVNIDPEEIEKKISRSTKVLIPVHFAGHPCDMKEINKIARKKKLLVIEDAAHAIGSVYRGSRIGSCKYSDMTIFSFHPVKTITTGEGGAVLTNRRDLYEKLLMLRNHGITKDKSHFLSRGFHSAGSWYYEMQCLGFNYRITDIQCALGISQLKKLDKFLKRRREVASLYTKKLSTIDEIILPAKRDYAASAWHIYCITVKKASERKRIFEELQISGIGVQVHYIPVYLHPYYRGKFKYDPGLCPMAEDYYSKAITLPLYPSMTRKQVNKVINVVKSVFRKTR